MVVAGETGKTRHQQVHVWPQPPAPARLRFVRSLYGEADIVGKSSNSFWKKLSAFIFGKRAQQLFVRPFGIATSDNGMLAVTDPGLPGVHLFHPGDKSFRTIGTKESDAPLRTPVGVAFSKRNTVLVADSRLGEIIEFSTDGKVLGRYGKGILKRPAGIAVRPDDGKVFVVDTKHHRLSIFDQNGKHLNHFGGRGKQAGKFNFPTHLTFDNNSNLYVTDTMNFRVQVFDRQLKPLRQFGHHGDRLGEFSKPKGIAVDSQQHIYVIESYFDHLLIFDNRGRFLLPVGGNGDKPGRFNLPAGISVQKDLVYVADSYNRRIQLFKLIKSQGKQAK